ncbi:MAG: carbohydrate binding domain-containing protein [Candidatus Kaelpia imicola]|nr:carbohydrate binding domain-containing protein [Candidatus Kaelpia imicola]
MRKELIFIVVISIMLYGCTNTAGGFSKYREQIFILQDFNADEYKGGVWEAVSNDKQASFKAELQARVRVGERGRAVALDYDFRSGADLVGGLWLDVSDHDFSGYNLLGFWIKGEPTLGFSKIVGVTIEDKFGNRVTKMNSQVSSEWGRVEISLNSLKDKRLSNIVEINVFIDKRYTSIEAGRCYIDDFYLK